MMKSLLEGLVEFIVGCAALAFVAGIVCIGFGAAIRDSERTCYRGSTPYLDCQLFEPCEHPRVIDLAAEYAKTHPECREPAEDTATFDRLYRDKALKRDAQVYPQIQKMQPIAEDVD